jgi:putative methylase
MNKKELAIILSRLKPLSQPDIKLEQYQTDSEIAAYLAWLAYLNNDVQGKTVADLGCGNGILGLASLILAAKKAYFIDVSEKAIEVAKENLAALESEFNVKFNAVFINEDIAKADIKTDTVIQNPPFGVKKEHADRQFLESAMKIANIIYSIHKSESQEFISKLAYKHEFIIESIREFNFPIKKTMQHHQKKVHNVKVACFILKRQD